MNRYVSFIVLCLFLLSSCAPTQPISTQTPSPTSTTQPAITPTFTPTSVAEPPAWVIDDLKKKGINVVHEYSRWRLRLGSVKVPDAYFDEGVKQLQLRAGGETYDIPLTHILKRVNVVDGAIVVNDIFGNPFMAFDPTLVSDKWSGRWIGTNEALREEFGYRIENWVVVNTVAELDEAGRLGKYLSKDFPAGTYLPPLDKIYREYNKTPWVLEGEYNSRYPFGTRTEFDHLPFKFVNYIMLLPNEAEKRPYYTCVVQEAVYNIDGTKGILNMPSTADDESRCTDWVWSKMAGSDHSRDNDEYILPSFWTKANLSNRTDWNRFLIDYYKQAGLIDKNGDLDASVKNLVMQWFDTGILPKELERIYVWGPTRTFKKWD